MKNKYFKNFLQASTKRRGSLKPRRGSIVPVQASKELPWDLFDRLLLPLLCCHAVAIIFSGLLNLLRISQVSTFTLFIWFAVSATGAILFYHHLKVKWKCCEIYFHIWKHTIFLKTIWTWTWYCTNYTYMCGVQCSPQCYCWKFVFIWKEKQLVNHIQLLVVEFSC